MSVHDFSCKNNGNSSIIGDAINAVRQHCSFYVNRIQGSVAVHENYIYITFILHIMKPDIFRWQVCGFKYL